VDPKTAPKKEESSSESEEVVKKNGKPKTTDSKKPEPTKTQPKTTTKKEESSSEEEEGESKKTAPPTKKKEGSEESESEELHIVKKDDNKGGKRKREDEKESNGDSSKKRKIDTNGGGGGNTRVRVGNLAFDLAGKDDEIKELFNECGGINKVELIQNREGRFAGVAIVEFDSKEAASKALEKDGEEFHGRQLKLSYANEEKGGGGGGNSGPTGAKPEGCNTVFIGNLNYQVTEEEVYEFFQQCGDIKQVRWPQGEFKGYGWVEFTDTESPDNAIKLAGKDLKGRAIKVDWAAPRKQREQW